MASLDPFDGGYPVAQFTATAIGTEATVLAAPGAGSKWYLTGLVIALSAAASILIREDTAGNIIFTVPLLGANTPLALDLGQGLLQSVANKPITMTSSAAANLSGTLFGRIERSQ